MRRLTLIAGLVCVAGAIVGLVALKGGALASAPEFPTVERTIVVTQELVVPAGASIISPPIDVRGYTWWGYQITVLSGAGAVSGSPVYRLASDLEWAEDWNGVATGRAVALLTPIGPEAAIKVRNGGTEPSRVAISAHLSWNPTWSRIGDDLLFETTAVVVDDGAELVLDDVFDLSEMHEFAVQLRTVEPASGIDARIGVKHFGRIKKQQDLTQLEQEIFELKGGGYNGDGEATSRIHARPVHFPQTGFLLKSNCTSGDCPVTASVVVYAWRFGQ